MNYLDLIECDNNISVINIPYIPIRGIAGKIIDKYTMLLKRFPRKMNRKQSLAFINRRFNAINRN